LRGDPTHPGTNQHPAKYKNRPSVTGYASCVLGRT
jgi:hypothetical protein